MGDGIHAQTGKGRRVVLFSTQVLLGEALANILRAMDDLEVVGPQVPDPTILARLPTESPDVVLLATDEGDSGESESLTSQLLARYPDLPLVQVSIEHNRVRIYTSRSVTAQSHDLIELIRGLPEKGDTW